jgi:carbonic anhydrase/acetyltransferase-like protein (isoleucine patch superfamily)
MHYALDAHVPVIDPTAWIADSATVIGQVTLGAEVGVWFGAVLRGDNDRIVVGDRTNVQEGCVLHTDAGWVLEVGAGVTVGHHAVLHGCTIEDNVLVGIKAVVMNGARVGRDSLIGANALVTENKVIPPRSLVVGSPGKVLRELTDAEVDFLRLSASMYAAKVTQYRAGLRALGSAR